MRNHRNSTANRGNILKKVFFRKNQKKAKKNEITAKYYTRARKTGKNPKVRKKHYFIVLIFRKTRFAKYCDYKSQKTAKNDTFRLIFRGEKREF